MNRSAPSAPSSAVSHTRPRSGAASAPATSPSTSSITWSIPAAIRSLDSRVRWTSTIRWSCTSCSSATSGARIAAAARGSSLLVVLGSLATSSDCATTRSGWPSHGRTS